MTRAADRLKGWAPWLFALAALLLVAHWASTRPLERRPGVLAPDEPVQTAIDVATPIDAGHGFRLTPRAQFAATVRVLASERYYIDAMAPIAPVDLAVGWGPMSDTAVLGALSISQSARFYFWQGRELPLPPADITRHSANWHIVPASATVYRTLRQLRPPSSLRRRLPRMPQTSTAPSERVMPPQIDPLYGNGTGTKASPSAR